MNDASTRHPPAEHLAAFRAGRLAAAEAAEVAAHLADCGECRGNAPVSQAETLRPESSGAAATVTPAPPTLEHALAEIPFDTPPASTRDVPAALADHPRYRVLKLLGRGGMGSVFKAEHRVMERPVALKVLNPDLIEDSAALQRFQQEVKAAARLSHPNIVTAHDADEAGGIHFLVMEFVEGKSLAEVVAANGPMPVSRACECIRQAALGLQHAFEKGMVHRDIKPQNLMLAPEGRVKILDFGLARFASERDRSRVAAAESEGGLTQTGMIMGTPDYMAPEQATDARRADIRADVYSMGCTLYHLLAGQPPFPEGGALQKVIQHLEKTPRPLHELRSEVPRELAAVVARMLAKKPEQRFQNPAEVAKVLAPFVKASAVVAPRPAKPGKSDLKPIVVPVPKTNESSAQAKPPKPARSDAKPIVVPVPKADDAPVIPFTPPIRGSRVVREVDRKDEPFEKATAAKSTKNTRRAPMPWLQQKPVWLAALALVVMVALAISMLNQESAKSTGTSPASGSAGPAAGGATAATNDPAGGSTPNSEPVAALTPVAEPGNIPANKAPLPGSALPSSQPPKPEIPRVGRLVIETEEPAARVVLKRNGQIVAGPTTDRLLELSPGNYEIDLAKPEPMLQFSTVRFELTPGSRKLVKISWLRLAWPEAGIAAPDLSKVKPQADYDLRDPKSKFPVRTEKPKTGSVDIGYGKGDVYFIDVRKPLGFGNWDVPIPSKPPKDFACEVVGKVGLANVVWGLRLLNARRDRAIDIALGNIGDMVVWRRTDKPADTPKAIAGPLKPASQKSGNQFNTLLVVLRGRFLEVYVNGRSVCDPITLETDELPAQLLINTQGTPVALHAEFQRLKLWSGEAIPSAQARGAVVK